VGEQSPGWRLVDVEALTRRLLGSLPNRLAHSLTAAEQARRVVSTVPDGDQELLIAAALLHDIGYAAPLIDSGFHPVDGATYLVRIGAPVRLADLVAHHSEARLLAPVVGASSQLAAFANEESPITDGLIYADMTAGPDGRRVDLHHRLADIHARHANEDADLLAARLSRVPRLIAAIDRVKRRMTGLPYSPQPVGLTSTDGARQADRVEASANRAEVDPHPAP
jgi:putative nucleotidyltransferase with HDIG domain